MRDKLRFGLNEGKCACHYEFQCPDVVQKELEEAKQTKEKKETALQCNAHGCKGNKWELIGDRQAQRCGYCFRVLRILNLPETE